MTSNREAIIRNYLEAQESIGNSLINTRRWADDKADEKFKKEYEELKEWNELYEPSELHPETGEILGWRLRDEWNDVYFGMMDEFEEELLEYKNEEYA